MVTDVLVVGAGPAGRALAGACRKAGLHTVLLDPQPDRTFPATYGSWAAELPPGLPESVVATRAKGRAIARGTHDLGWDYAVLDVPALRTHLDAGLVDVEVRTGRAVGFHPGEAGAASVTLADGGELTASVVIDCGGRDQPLARARPFGRRHTSRAGEADNQPSHQKIAAEQTAFGIVVPENAAAPLVPPGEALFMDWRRDHGEGGWPTFLYGIPLGGGEVLLEETSLARRPGLSVPVLRRRLLARLAHHGIEVPAGARTETVRFPVDRPRHDIPGALGFGAAAPLVHPATGFSIATSLRLAQPVADAVAAHVPQGPAVALDAARQVIWSRSSTLVDRVRRIGLEALLRMPPEEVPDFFDVFFALPEHHRWAYLTGRDDVTGTLRAMGALFAASDTRLRGRLVLPALRRPLHSNEARERQA